MTRPKALYENVTIRGRTVYIWLPKGPGKGRRRLAARWIRHDPNGRSKPESKLKAGYETLTRIETLLVNTVPPRWDLVAAIHDGRLDLHTVHATLMQPDGVKRLEEQLTSETEQGRLDTLVAPLIDEWPAMPLGKQTRPEEQTRIERRNRMRRIALTLPTLRHWTPDALQRVLSPDTDALETRELKGVGNWETQRTYRNDLKMFCAWLVVQGYITVNPAEELRVDKREQRAIRCVSFDVLKRIHQQLPPGPARDAFGLMMATGAEPQVVARVTPECLRPKEQKVVLSGTKNQYRTRVAFVESWYWPRLVELAKGKRSTDGLIPMTRFDIADAVREAVQALRDADPDIDIPEDFRPYDVRHSYAARYVAAGAVFRVLADQLGHKDERMIIALYGRFRADTSALAAFESQAVTFRTAPAATLDVLSASAETSALSVSEPSMSDGAAAIWGG